MAFDIRKFTARFVEESREHLEGFNTGLVELEKNPEDGESINAVFRTAHTIKGASRMLKLTDVTEVAHRLEDVLAALRDRKLAHSRELSNLMFKGVDALSTMIEKIAGGEEITMDNSALCEELVRAAEGSREGDAPEPEGPPEKSAPGEIPAAEKAPSGSEEGGAGPPPGEAAGPAAKESKVIGVTETIRVRAEKLDDLIRLMGEVVSHQNKLKRRMQDIADIERKAKRSLEILEGGANDKVLLSAQSVYSDLKHLLSGMRQDRGIEEILTAEFQEKALMMRMVPLSTVFGPLHRLVRDIAGSLGKAVDFEVEGGDIELDKKIVEKLGDPLVHMIRNSIDHGVEDADVRARAGKPPRGRVMLSASYDVGNILIRLSDDGRGISTEKIRQKALSKKLFDAAALDDMQEEALLDLIFLPGFSTSGLITDVSGRGVGMDVVKKNIIEDLRGSVHVETKEDLGSTFSIRLPMTLAIMRVLLVVCRGRTFGVTTNYITEILNVTEDEIIDVADKKALRLREELIAVADMGRLLKIAGNGSGSAGKKLVLIVRAGSEKMGLALDSLVDEEDMVIKSLPDHMTGVRLVSGVTITGGNEIINILNVPALMEAARSVRGEATARPEEDGGERKMNILVVDDSLSTREIEKNILESYGYNVMIASDGVEALEKAESLKFDLVITDVEMPRLDGFSLTERLRSDDSYRDVPVIIVTSRGDEADKMRGIEVGANAYITKGTFDQGNLIETVQNLIGRAAGL